MRITVKLPLRRKVCATNGTSMTAKCWCVFCLRHLDFAWHASGVVNGSVKISARVLCPVDRVHEFRRWNPAFVRATISVQGQDDSTTALGAPSSSLQLVKNMPRNSAKSGNGLRCGTLLAVDPCARRGRREAQRGLFHTATGPPACHL